MNQEIENKNDEKLNVLISTDLKKRYKIYCITNGFILSERIRDIMEKDIIGDFTKNKL